MARITTTLKKGEPLPFTPHLKASCERLAVFREYESDRLLVQLVAIQHIAHSISCRLNGTFYSPASNEVPLKIFIESTQIELDTFKQNLPSDLQQNRKLSLIHEDIVNVTSITASILCHFQATEIALYEIVMYHAFNGEEENAHRLSMLYSCLLAVKTFFSTHNAPDFPVTTAR